MFAPYNDTNSTEPRCFMEIRKRFDFENSDDIMDLDFADIDTVNRKMREDRENGVEIDIIDRTPSKKSDYSKKSNPKTTTPIITTIQAAEKSLQETLAFIENKNYKVEKPSITDNDEKESLTFDNLITAASENYCIYLESQKITLFSEKSPLNNQSSVLSQEQSDHLLAIQYQNEEIQKYVSSKSRK